jgi:DNA-binding transcriptional MerR regulator
MDVPSAPEPLGLLDLSEKAQVSPRTIRYYIQQGLLPAPEARGPGAHYGPEHVDRLILIRRLQKEHLPLSEIRKRIEKLSPEEVTSILGSDPEKPPGSASDYVKRVLSEGLGILAPRETMAMYSPEYAARARAPAPAPSPPKKKPGAVLRSQWEHFALAPDVELHVRRPVSREDNRRIERLLDAARDIFNEETR